MAQKAIKVQTVCDPGPVDDCDVIALPLKIACEWWEIICQNSESTRGLL